MPSALVVTGSSSSGSPPHPDAPSPAVGGNVFAEIDRRGDRWMAVFLALHAVLAVALAPLHGTWHATAATVVLAAGGFAVCLWRRPGTLLTRAVAGVALQAFCVLHVFQMRGLAEMHFFYFTATTAMVIYQDRRAIWPGVAAIIAQHSLFAHWHNAGLHPGGQPFFEPDRVTLLKITFHFGIILVQAAVASHWAEVLRRRTLRDADASRRLHAQTEALVASERRFRTVVESIDQGLLITDEGDRIVYANSRAARITGYAPEELVGRVGYEILVPVEERPAFLARMAERLAGAEDRYELALVRKDGTRVWTENGGVPFRDAAGAVVGTIGVIADITARKALEAELTRRAFVDPLTGLANRPRFRERVLAAQTRAGAARVPAVLFVDLDEFKTVNDSLGHAAGDALLATVAERLLGATRGSDTVARLGGDEFAILLTAVPDDEAAAVAAARVVAAVAAPVALCGREIRVTASVGIAVARGGESPDDLLRNADLALYRAKERGKGRFECFAPAMHAAAVERLELEADLRRALADGELMLHYQPVVDLASGHAVGAEALARWRHPERGLVPPGVFVPVAEATDLIVPLSRWALAEACAAAARWPGEEPGGAPPLSIAVNVSGRHLQRAGFVEDVAAALRTSGLAPRRLVLEVTESVLLADLDTAVGRLEALRALGVRVALDDFGTGYSSLAYLERLPVDVLKIDRAFTADITAGGKRAALARAVVTIADTLGLRTVAEGVETAAQRAELSALGCALGQGYLFARPLDDGALRALLADGRRLGPGAAAPDAALDPAPALEPAGAAA
jgi:diguanylate cyclase (GGDEF)-like protein/PAS domain S-box-containing protein